ncbi:MAG: exodeoxyribonuclease III [Spirochaetaceae bacterium]|jgi:exodeoxyribonuclease-3|nr:exodeoxyribonuclease III [Spirochaetaceae bacterium]
MVRIFSWNVNGVRAVEKKGFIPWLLSTGADVVCLQETKARPDQLPPALKAPSGYRSFWASAKKPGYAGTAIFCASEPDEVFFLGDSAFDDEGRVVAARFGHLVAVSAYFPNSQEGGARLDYMLAFCDAILRFCDGLAAQGRNVVLSGDYNIAHRPIDLARPEANVGNPGYLPEERAWMDRFTAGGWVDTFRHFCPEANHYTWWSYRFKAREKNIGWRIDYQCVNSAFLPRVVESKIHPQVSGSDHCPVSVSLDI